MDATGSKAATTLFVAIPAVLFMNSSRGISACASRVLLSMGRDNVLPFSKSFEIVKMGEPLVGLALSTVVAILLGLVQLGSTAAFNSLLGSATIMFQFTYGGFKCITISDTSHAACHDVARRSKAAERVYAWEDV
jgi:choline transport protein